MFMNHAFTHFNPFTIHISSNNCNEIRTPYNWCEFFKMLLKWRNNWIHFIHFSLSPTLWQCKSAFHMQKFMGNKSWTETESKSISCCYSYCSLFLFYVDKWREAFTMKWITLNAKSFSMKWVCKLTSFADDGPWNGRVIQRTKVDESGNGNAYIPIMSMPINTIDTKWTNERTKQKLIWKNGRMSQKKFAICTTVDMHIISRKCSEMELAET